MRKEIIFPLVLVLAVMGEITYAQVVSSPSPNIDVIPCSHFKDCLTCSENPRCGWCDVTKECVEGTGMGSHGTTCPSWFFYGCFSVQYTVECSDEIVPLSCEETHCNDTKPDYNDAVCEHCRSVAACFDLKDDAICPSWNETRCPNGAPARNDSIPVVKIADNVKAIDPADTTLYTCPVIFPPEDGEGATLLVAPTPTGFKVGDIIVSGQAGGIMHTVDSITPQGPYAFVMASAANLEDVVTYIDFRATIDPVSIEDETTTEHIPDQSLLYTALNEDLQDYGTFHAVQNDIDVYKCTGEKYISGQGVEWTSTFFVMTRSDFNELSAMAGDVLAGNNSVGWLETITNISSSGDFSYVESKLVNCGEMLPHGNRLKLASGSDRIDEAPDLHCQGGDNTDGLMVYRGQAIEDLNFQLGDIVVGRNSGPFMSKVMSWTEVGDFVFIEASPMSDLHGTSTYNSTSLARRRRKVFLGFHFLLNAPLSSSIVGEHGRASFTIDPFVEIRVELELDLGWGWSFPFVKRAGAKFTGQAGFGLKATALIQGSLSTSWREKVAEGIIPPKICLPIIWFLCIPAKLSYEVYAGFQISSNVTAEVTAEGRADANLTLGAHWQFGTDVSPFYEPGLTFTADKKAKAELKGVSEIICSITPTLMFDLPSESIPVAIPSLLLNSLPHWLRDAVATHRRPRFVLFHLALTVQVIAEVSAGFCPALGHIEWEVGIDDAETTVYINILELQRYEKMIRHKLGWVTSGKKKFQDCQSTNATSSTVTTYPSGTSFINAPTIDYETSKPLSTPPRLLGTPPQPTTSIATTSHSTTTLPKMIFLIFLVCVSK